MEEIISNINSNKSNGGNGNNKLENIGNNYNRGITRSKSINMNRNTRVSIKS